VTTETFIETRCTNAKKPLPTRRRLLTFFALWSGIALLSASNIGLCIGRAMWHSPFSMLDLKNWTPIFLLFAGIINALTQLQLILGGSYRGGAADEDTLEPAS